MAWNIWRTTRLNWDIWRTSTTFQDCSSWWRITSITTATTKMPMKSWAWLNRASCTGPSANLLKVICLFFSLLSLCTPNCVLMARFISVVRSVAESTWTPSDTNFEWPFYQSKSSLAWLLFIGYFLLGFLVKPLLLVRFRKSSREGIKANKVELQFGLEVLH